MTRSRRLVVRAILVVSLLGLGVFLTKVHPFLALNEPVDADVLVIEGWVPRYVLEGAVRELQQGPYAWIFVSGLEEPDGVSDATMSARHLMAAGVAPEHVVEAPTRATGWNRTSLMARAVRDRLRARGIQPRGVNVLTLGPHARQSRLAYRRMLGPEVRVGVISIPKDDYDPTWWWLSAAGIKKTTKDFAGWARELLLGLRS